MSHVITEEKQDCQILRRKKVLKTCWTWATIVQSIKNPTERATDKILRYTDLKLDTAQEMLMTLRLLSKERDLCLNAHKRPYASGEAKVGDFWKIQEISLTDARTHKIPSSRAPVRVKMAEKNMV